MAHHSIAYFRVQYSAVQYGMVWYGMLWYGMAEYSIVLCSTVESINTRILQSGSQVQDNEDSRNHGL